MSTVAWIACGYHAVYGGAGGTALHVTLARSLVSDGIASDEVLAGMREELAVQGLLESGDGYPRAEVEVLRADATSEGIQAAGSGVLARGTAVAMVARAWVVAQRNGPPARDTGDMRAAVVVALDEAAGGLDPRAAVFHDADARRAAGRRLGHKLALKLVGAPSSTDEDLNRP
ncbi:MAG: hypothetical protein ABSC94_16625 [Polyangiaceae bacterium]